MNGAPISPEPASCYFCKGKGINPGPGNMTSCPVCEGRGLSPAPSSPELAEAIVEDFCGVQQERIDAETRMGTLFSVSKWKCPSCARPCSALYIDDEWCHGDSLCLTGQSSIQCGQCCYQSATPAQEGKADDALTDILCTLKHARKFIVSREVMHPEGVRLFDLEVEKLEAMQAPASKEVR